MLGGASFERLKSKYILCDYCCHQRIILAKAIFERLGIIDSIFGEENEPEF